MTQTITNTEKAGTTVRMTADSFSWKRVGEVAHYYSPTVNRQLTAYGAVSLIFAIMLLMPLNAFTQTGIFYGIYTALPLIFVLAPISLAKGGDTRVVDRMLPAKASEKYLFLLLYFLVAIPIAIYVMPELALWLYTKIPAIQTEEMLTLIDMRFLSYKYPVNTIMNVITYVAVVLTCLFVIEYARHSRIIKAVVSVLGIQFVIGIMGAVYGFSLALRRGLGNGANGPILNEQQQTDYLKDFMSDFMQGSPLHTIIITLLIIYIGVMLWLIYRTLRKRNL